ncbi:MAG TPA: SDR family oxidoreductase [Verrucomicrobiae bacterium]|nr:SDR family oxidoreductase [Verrucomicrobiae bacterium]
MSTQSKPHSLEGRVVLVTGGGRGIGREIAQTMAAAGAKVAVMARTIPQIHETVAMIRQAGGQAEAFAADVTKVDAVETAVLEIEKDLGPVDVLVNNAGTVKPFGPLWSADLSEWWSGVETNLLGPVVCSRAVLPGMTMRRRGWIINVASGGGTMGTPFFSSYIVSKTALIRLTECVALETRPHGVCVFAISPGTVRTEMSEYSLHSPEGKKWLPWFQRIFDEDIQVPAARAAQLVLTLASGRADALSGRFISVFDDVETLLGQAGEIEQQNLYLLKLDKVPGSAGNPALASILKEARQAAERPELQSAPAVGTQKLA